MCHLITPNLPEAIKLTDINAPPVQLAASCLALGAQAVLIKGGHANTSTADDFYADQQGNSAWFSSPRINTRNTHGTGCTLSAAICANIAQGKELKAACEQAKQYLQNALMAAVNCNIGNGCGPVHHFHNLSSENNL